MLDSALKVYAPAEVSDASTNGGRMTATEIVSAVMQNVFAHVFKAERAIGSTVYRKLFHKVADDSDGTLSNSGYCFDGPTAGDDYVCFWPGTQTDQQGDITGSERKYGAGILASGVTGGSSTTLIVDVEHTDLIGIYADGDTLRVSDKPTPDSSTGNEELVTVSGTPTVSGTQVTIPLAAAVVNSYAATVTKVASVYEPGDVACSVDNWVETSTAGTYDETTYPVICDNIGTIEQTWTLTFTSATDFGVSGDTVGSVGTGSTAADFVPTNSDFSKPYFTLEYLGFGGTWASGDTIVFKTHPAATPIWEKRKVPAGAGSMANNKIIAITTGESI